MQNNAIMESRLLKKIRGYLKCCFTVHCLICLCTINTYSNLHILKFPTLINGKRFYLKQYTFNFCLKAGKFNCFIFEFFLLLKNRMFRILQLLFFVEDIKTLNHFLIFNFNSNVNYLWRIFVYTVY